MKCTTPIPTSGLTPFHGLPLVTPAQFISATSPVVNKPLERPVEATLLEVHKWSNKELAHFTLTRLWGVRDLSLIQDNNPERISWREKCVVIFALH